MVSFNRCQSPFTLIDGVIIKAGQQVINAILKAETVHDIFVPVLPEKGVKSLSEFIATEGTSWSTALAVCTTDFNGRRPKGSAWCKPFFQQRTNYVKLTIFRLGGGWAGTEYFMDPTTGISAMFGVQVAPPPDIEVRKNVIVKLERTLYEGLEIGSDKLWNTEVSCTNHSL